METAISLGSNLGDRLAHLQKARAALLALPRTRLVAASPVYETEPVDVPAPHQSLRFLNAILILATDFPLPALLAALHRVEAEAGRTRSALRNAPRPLDLDIIYADQETSESPELTLPHPRWSGRRFVVQPLADVRPDLVLPGQTRSVAQILSALPAEPKVVLFAGRW